MPSRPGSSRLATVHRYGLAIAGVGAATLVRFALNPYVGNRLPYLPFFFAVIPVASALGVGPALVAIVLATISSATFFIPPFDGLGVETVTGLIGLALFVGVNLVIVWTAEQSRFARRRLEREVAERIRIEEALHAAKREAEEANQAKDRFLAVLSHELRTPLNPISLALNSILGKPGIDDDIRGDLELIRHYLGLEARMIDDLLDVMRIARGKMPLRWEVADAHDLVRQAIGICAEELRDRALRLSIDLDAAWATVRADPSRLRQVFWNLVKNAAKFTPVGGSIAIRSRNEPAAEGGDDLIIEVADTGIGVEPDVLPRIFEAFQQGDSAITRRFGGLGLGLAICQGVVEGHGGTLTAASPGKDRGTTFAVRLGTVPAAADAEDAPGPVAPVAEDEPARLAPLSPRRYEPLGVDAPRAIEASLQVLLVEDEPATIRLMARLLRGLGYQVTAAGTVAEATRHVAGPQPFDLIVSDIGLPDGTGLDLMRHVRDARGDLPGIALTGFGTDDDIEQSRRAGFVAHLTKPIDFAQLESLIRLVVGPAAAPR